MYLEPELRDAAYFGHLSYGQRRRIMVILDRAITSTMPSTKWLAILVLANSYGVTPHTIERVLHHYRVDGRTRTACYVWNVLVNHGAGGYRIVMRG